MRQKSRWPVARFVVGVALGVVVLSSCAYIARVSVSGTGDEGNRRSGHWVSYWQGPSISGDGRYVAFESEATNLVADDSNNKPDIFVRDIVARTTTRVSVDGAGGEADGSSRGATISNDGRYVAFQSAATNLVPADNNGVGDIFLRDTVAGTTTRLSVDSSGTEANGASGRPEISSHGDYVVFDSLASNLVAGDTNGFSDVFLHDIAAGTTTRVSLDATGGEGNADSGGGASKQPQTISADGRSVAFDSVPSNLVAGDTNGFGDVFLRDTTAGTTELVSDVGSPPPYNGKQDSYDAAISDDGAHVAFTTIYVSNGPWQWRIPNVSVRDIAAATTNLVIPGGSQPSIHSATQRDTARRRACTRHVPGMYPTSLSLPPEGRLCSSRAADHPFSTERQDRVGEWMSVELRRVLTAHQPQLIGR